MKMHAFRNGVVALLATLLVSLAPQGYAAGLSTSGAASLSASTSSSRVALPNTDSTIVIWNTGSAEAFYKLGSVSVTAATTDYSIPAGGAIVVDKAGSANTNLAAITSSGSTTLRITQGAGLPALGGGGSSGGGGTSDATAANQVTGNNTLSAISGKLPAALGGTTASASLPVVLSSDGPFATQTGGVTETAPATDTASSGLNGRLQRIAQRLTTVNTTLGTPLQAGGNVAVASSALPSGAATETSAAAAAASLAVVDDVGAGVSVTLTRTADTSVYLANDVVGAATGSTAALSFANVGPSGREVMLTSASLKINATAIISGETSYNLWCYPVTPPSALGDNAPFDIPSGDQATAIYKIPLGTPTDEGSTLLVQSDSINKQITLSGTGLFCYLVTVGAYTPTSARVYVINLHFAPI